MGFPGAQGCQECSFWQLFNSEAYYKKQVIDTQCNYEDIVIPVNNVTDNLNNNNNPTISNPVSPIVTPTSTVTVPVIEESESSSSSGGLVAGIVIPVLLIAAGIITWVLIS